jgi:putative ABC transport system substrate-binding protein
MRRRDFIPLLGSAAVAWPLSARAQRNERMRRIGVFFAGAANANDTDTQSRLAAFQQGLQQLGWSDGRNLQINYRFGGGNAALIRKYAEELVALSPEVLFSSGAATVAPLLHVTRTVPIIFAGVVDPVGAGFVNTLARPGGNATGFILFEYSLGGKWLELLKQMAPGVTRAAVIRDAALSSGTGQFGAVQSVAPSLGVEVSPINLRDTTEIERDVAHKEEVMKLYLRPARVRSLLTGCSERDAPC